VGGRTAFGPQTVAELDQADQYVPDSPPNPPGRPSEPSCSPWRPKLDSTHLLTAASGRDLRTAGDMAAVLAWRLPALAPTNPGPLPWLPGFQQRSVAIRSGAVPGKAIPAGRRTRRPGPRPRLPRRRSASLGCGGNSRQRPRRRNRSVAGRNGLNPQDPRPTGGTQLETLRPSGNNASTGISRVPRTREQMRGPTSDRQHTSQLDAGTTTASACTKNPNVVRKGVRARPITHRSR
jgi:hypothetical protein